MSKNRVKQSGQSHRGGGVGGAANSIIGLSLLLVLPVYALSRVSESGMGYLWGGIPLVVSVFTFLAYRTDKRRAESGAWRISESTLHLAELLGGWPGAFLAQRTFRHKTSKPSYQITFWAIVLVYQWVAFDSLVDWRFSKAALAGF